MIVLAYGGLRDRGSKGADNARYAMDGLAPEGKPRIVSY